MSHADFAQLREVEQGQALGEELAVDDALAEAGDDAEADAAGELVERGADAAEVVRIDMLEAVAENDPVDALAGRLGALGAAVPDQFGIKARAGDLEAFGIDLADQVQVDEAVVHRRDQSVGLDDRGAGDRIVAAGRVDDDDVRLDREAADRGFEAGFGRILEHFEGGAGSSSSSRTIVAARFSR